MDAVLAYALSGIANRAPVTDLRAREGLSLDAAPVAAQPSSIERVTSAFMG